MGFEVGDKVRILDGTKQEGWNPRGLMKETIGMVGKITDIDRHDPKYRVTFENDWWDYNEEDLEKENNMNLELTNLTEEQKKQIIDLAEKFKQENEVDKLDYEKDYMVFNGSLEFPRRMKLTECEFKDQFFDLGLTAHTKEDAEKIRRRLSVEKELRDWAKKCKEPVDIGNTNQEKYYVQYETDCCEISIDGFYTYAVANILFTDESILKQAIESIGQERLIRDYFGIDN